jgi:hypothetical protein
MDLHQSGQRIIFYSSSIGCPRRVRWITLASTNAKVFVSWLRTGGCSFTHSAPMHGICAERRSIRSTSTGGPSETTLRKPPGPSTPTQPPIPPLLPAGREPRRFAGGDNAILVAVIGMNPGAAVTFAVHSARRVRQVIWIPSSDAQALAASGRTPEERCEKLEQLMGHPLPAEIVVGELDDARRAAVVLWATDPLDLPRLIDAWKRRDHATATKRPVMISGICGYGSDGVLPYHLLQSSLPDYVWINLTGVMAPPTVSLGDSTEDRLARSLRTFVLSGEASLNGTVQKILEGEGTLLAHGSEPGIHGHGSALVQATSFLGGALSAWPDFAWAVFGASARRKTMCALMTELLRGADHEMVSELVSGSAFLAEFLFGVFCDLKSGKRPREHLAGSDLLKARENEREMELGLRSLGSHRLGETERGLLALHEVLGRPTREDAPIWNALLDVFDHSGDFEDSSLAGEVRGYFEPPEISKCDQDATVDARIDSILGLMVWTASYLTNRVATNYFGIHERRGEPTRASMTACIVSEVFRNLEASDQMLVCEAVTSGRLLQALAELNTASGLAAVEDPHRRLLIPLKTLGWDPAVQDSFPILRSVLEDLRNEEVAQRAIRKALGS